MIPSSMSFGKWSVRRLAAHSRSRKKVLPFELYVKRWKARLCIPVCCTALSVLWLALHKEKFPLLADTLLAAAGVAGKQKWALILPSSAARVSMVTYTTVIAVRYPELDNVQNDLTCFGNYLLGAQSTHGGFLPVFWDAPSAYMHAATDIGSVVEWVRSQFQLTSDENGCLAVLHNRNKMVTTLGNSEWATQSEGSVQSKSVTSCAGMTAHLVLLAQTRVGFLSGGRSKRMNDFLRMNSWRNLRRLMPGLPLP